MTDTIRMPCLTLWQPWAALVAAGLKPIENRTYAPPATIRGKRIAIHAGKTYDQTANSNSFVATAVDQLKHEPDLHFLSWENGTIIATADVIGFYEPGPYFVHWAGSWKVVSRSEMKERELEIRWWMRDQFGWLLGNIRPLTNPIPATGRQGIWYHDIPRDALESSVTPKIERGPTSAIRVDGKVLR